MSEESQSWKPNRRDAVFLAIIAAVVLALVLGTSERKTRAVPDDATHQQATSLSACMACHAQDGIRPQPKGHIQSGQCFQCHLQPDGWVGAGK